MSVSRKLAAILFTDIVGYTAMMREDESIAVASVRRYAGVLQELVARHGGLVLNNFGDGSLCTFPSVDQAISCARELQQSLQMPPAIPLRIGLHLGEIYMEDDKAFGDSVNIASRLTALGQANSILVSKDIHAALRNRPEFPLKALGSFHFKHVEEPVAVFALALDGLSVPTTFPDAKLKQPSSARLWYGAGLALIIAIVVSLIYLKVSSPPEAPKVAILPFTNESPEADIGWLSVGLAEEMIRSLSERKELAVVPLASTYPFRDGHQPLNEIARKLKADYYVSGTVRKQGDEYAVYVELIRWSDQTSVLAKPYLKKANELLLFKAELANQLARELATEATPAPTVDSPDNTTSTQAWEMYQRGVVANNAGFSSFDDAYLVEAETYFREALREDPAYVPAICLLADVYDTRFNPDKQLTGKAGIIRDSLARIAYRLNPNSKLSLSMMGLSFIKRSKPNSDSAFFFLKTAFERYPNDAEVLRALGTFYIFIGMSDEGNQALEKAMRIDPLFMPTRRESAFCYYYTDEFDKAEEDFKQILRLNPVHRDSINLSRVYLRAGKFEEFGKLNDTWRNSDTLYFRLNTGLLLAAEGKEQEALKFVTADGMVASLLGRTDSLLTYLKRSMKREVATFQTLNGNIIYSIAALDRGQYWRSVRQNQEFIRMREEIRRSYEAKRRKYFIDVR